MNRQKRFIQLDTWLDTKEPLFHVKNIHTDKILDYQVLSIKIKMEARQETPMDLTCVAVVFSVESRWPFLCKAIHRLENQYQIIDK